MAFPFFFISDFEEGAVITRVLPNATIAFEAEYFIDDAIEEIIWGDEHGLRGGVMLPGVSPDTSWIDPLFSPKYDPIWRLCQERGIPITHHGGGTGVPKMPPARRTPA